MKKGINILLLFSAVFFVFWGCETSINPLNEEKGIYSIYGYLDLNKEENYIRVKNLNKPLSEMDEDSIDADVTFTNLANGNSNKLKDTVVTFDGVKTHNYGINMDLQPDTKYQVRVERSDGRETLATATTPAIADRNLTPSNAGCFSNIQLKFRPVRSRFAMDLEIGIPFDDKIFWTKMDSDLIDANNVVRINFTPWYIIRKVFGGNNPAGFESEQVYCSDLSDDTYRVRYTHFGPDLSRNTISDTLSAPGGAGKFGALYNDSFSFKIDTSAVCPPQPREQCM